MLFKKRWIPPVINFSISNRDIDRVAQFTFLGIILDKNVSSVFLCSSVQLKYTNDKVPQCDENNLICEKQYGFRKNHSTEYAALHIVDFLNYQLDANKIPVSVNLDLSKAFDSLSHKILLDKIKHLGITGLAYKSLQSYLLNHQQYIAFKNCRSDLKFINNGVPQGSILEPC